MRQLRLQRTLALPAWLGLTAVAAACAGDVARDGDCGPGADAHCSDGVDEVAVDRGADEVAVDGGADGDIDAPDAGDVPVEADGPAEVDAGADDGAEPDDGDASDGGPPHAETDRLRINYLVMPHPDDEFTAWSLIEDQPEVYQVFVTLTRGDACIGWPYYEPALGEAPPGNDPDYASAADCGTLRVGSTLAFYEAMMRLDPYLGPLPTWHEDRTGTALAPGDPGHGCEVTSDRFAIWVGRNVALLFFDLGDTNLRRCEVEWALSQTRALRGSWYLPDLPEADLVAAATYNDGRFEDCFVYANPDHLATHEALWLTDFGTPGGQYGRTCRADPDQSLVGTVRQYSAMDLAGTTRVGAMQVYYGWLYDGPIPAGNEAATAFSYDQAFWVRF
jgi:hypothetical protein